MVSLLVWDQGAKVRFLLPRPSFCSPSWRWVNGVAECTLRGQSLNIVAQLNGMCASYYKLFLWCQSQLDRRRIANPRQIEFDSLWHFQFSGKFGRQVRACMGVGTDHPRDIQRQGVITLSTNDALDGFESHLLHQVLFM